MLPRNVKCPRCGKPGFLSLRPVHSSHYSKIKIPHKRPKRVWIQMINPAVGRGEWPSKKVIRWRTLYGPFWHFYIGHYDSERYRNAMEKYKIGKLKSRPNGRRWCKVLHNRAKGEAQSDLEKLKNMYDFTSRDISEVEDRKRKAWWQKQDKLKGR